EEWRMAMVDGQRLYDLNIEAPASERKKANIYKGKITRIEPSLEAAFVDYGADRHGFLPLKEISSEYFVKENKAGGKPSIKDVLKEGQDIVVQVDKEERGNKGAALTTFVSLAGRFIVLKPNKDRSGGVSRRITGGDRDLARKSLNEIVVPDGMSVILRTAGIDRSAEELAWDLENLLTVWTAILNVVLERPSPFLIYRESDSVVRALRDYLTNEIGEILIDDEATYKDAHEFVEQVMPHNLKKLKHYVDPVPLFTRFQIETQIESAFAHAVTLPSGGSIVIDHTEALVSIDINSARATKGGDIEATAINTNLEAAEEIARQLRIRDLGGLVVIDFIDMGPQKNQRDVENRLRDAVRQDRARVQIGKISRFGLLEMSRQRLRPSISESAYQTCPRCSGFGTIRSVESLALAILRIIGEEARKERTSKVIAQLPVEVATYLLNEKRDWVQSLESRHDTHVVLVANSALETPHYEVRRVRDDQLELAENAGVSYELTHTSAEPETPQAILARKAVEQPVVGTMKPTSTAPKPQQPPQKSLWSKLVAFFAGDDDKKTKAQPRRKKSSQGSQGRRSQQPRRRSGSDSRNASDNRRPPRKKTSTRKTAAKKAPAKKQPAKDGQQKPAEARAQQETSDESRGEQVRSSRNRRSRGGRKRRRTADKPEQLADNQVAKTQESKPAEKAPTPPKTSQDAGPPRARTDDERSRDAARRDDVASQRAPVAEKAADSGPKPKPESAPKAADSTPKPKPEPAPKAADSTPRPKPEPAPKAADSAPKPKPEPRPARDNGGQAQPTTRLLPWEPQAAADIKPPPKTAAPKPAPKPEAVRATDPLPAPAPKPDSKPAEPAQD
ncbi:MAG: Rne/Rng family ribonuclease, partial [Gammaproteobacteria bacterium]|nr:Rne/Rng family ribonuclease [Gammaproteobacteria bacterium]